MTAHSAGSRLIGEREFRRISAWVHQHAGIYLSDQKRALVAGRLASRLRHFQLAGYGAYFDLLRDPSHPEEAQLAIDLLTTNETHFFREPRHFDALRDRVLAHQPRSRMMRVWSAACASGEEPYSIGMILASHMGDGPWEILASDLSRRVLNKAAQALYPVDQAREIPREHLHAHCLKGVGQHQGVFKIAPHITSRVQFTQINLNTQLPITTEFDVIFLRNVMIYFDLATKQQVVDRISARLRPGGLLMIGHAESLAALTTDLISVAPAIYRKPR